MKWFSNVKRGINIIRIAPEGSVKKFLVWTVLGLPVPLVDIFWAWTGFATKTLAR
jgi:hypothetical protein